MSVVIREPKSLWRTLLDIFTKRVEPKTPAQWVQEHAEAVRKAPHSERAGILAVTLFAKKTLDTTRQVEMPFPDAYIAGEKPIDAAAQAELAAYAVALVQFQAALFANDTTVSIAAARGMTTWIATIYSAAIPGLLPQGKEIWQQLATASDGVEEGYKFFLRRQPSDVERTYFSYRPMLLLG